jgi:hypothetical protein
MRTRAAIVVAALTIGAPVAAPTVVNATTGSRTAIGARTCGNGYTHAVIGGAEKCLRRGQFCARRHDRQYERYGFRCIKRDRRGNYHLT